MQRWVGRDLSWFDSYLSQKFINRSIKKNACDFFCDSRSTTHSISHNSINSYCVCYFFFYCVWHVQAFAACHLYFAFPLCNLREVERHQNNGNNNEKKEAARTSHFIGLVHLIASRTCRYRWRFCHFSSACCFFPPSFFLIYYL